MWFTELGQSLRVRGPKWPLSSLMPRAGPETNVWGSDHTAVYLHVFVSMSDHANRSTKKRLSDLSARVGMAFYSFGNQS